ncbi:MAG: nucleotide sugar dehydrogenase [Patescibacteria group bacterium]
MGQLLNKNLIIVGIGRVGLPLALVLANEGFNVVGVDVSTKLLETISKGHLPFTEEGAEPLLKKLYNNGFVVRHENELAKILSQSSAIILTLGTPMSDNFSPDVTQVTGFLEKFSSHFKKKQLLVLRSTVTPGTTEYIDRYLLEKYNWKVGKDLYLAYCPERIAEGKAVEELYEIPQIIGTVDRESAKIAAKIFQKLTKKILYTDSRSAELAKLYSNMYRYIDFAIGNEFLLIADDHQRDIYEILRLVNDGYKRGGLKGPGFTAGPCLVKDGFFLLDKSPYLDLVAAAWRLNENIPGFILHKIKERLGNLVGKKVALLGLAFKKNIDDMRYSLSLKLQNYLMTEGAKVLSSDPFIPSSPLTETLRDSDVVILATNHNQFYKLKLSTLKKLVAKNCLVCDIWNVFGTGKIIFSLKDIK